MHLLPVNNGDERLPWAEPVVPMYQTFCPSSLLGRSES